MLFWSLETSPFDLCHGSTKVKKIPVMLHRGWSWHHWLRKQWWQPPFQKECCKSSKSSLGPHKGTVTFGVTATEPTDGLMVKSTLQSYLQAAYPKFIPLKACLVRSLEIFLSGSFSMGQPKTKHLETSLTCPMHISYVQTETHFSTHI